MTPAHETDRLAEMVCSNSFRSDDAENNAVGLLHQEMRALDSLIMRAADRHRVPAGSALAVDRDGFAAEVTSCLAGHPGIEVVRGILGSEHTLDKWLRVRPIVFHQGFQVFCAGKIFITATEVFTGDHKSDLL